MLAVLSAGTARYESIAAGSGGPDTSPRCSPPCGCPAAMLPTPIPTTTAPLIFRNSRRSTTGALSTSCLSLSRTVRLRHLLRRAMNRRDDPRIRTAPADMTVHRRSDLCFGRLRRLEQQLRAFDDLTVVAVAALYRLFRDHRLLQRMQLRRWCDLHSCRVVRWQPFQCRQRFPRHPRHRRNARSNFEPIRQNRTTSTLAEPAAEPRPLQRKIVGERVQKRRGRMDIEG